VAAGRIMRPSIEPSRAQASESSDDRGDDPGPGQGVEYHDEHYRRGQGPALAVGPGGALVPKHVAGGPRGYRFVAPGPTARLCCNWTLSLANQMFNKG